MPLPSDAPDSPPPTPWSPAGGPHADPSGCREPARLIADAREEAVVVEMRRAGAWGSVDTLWARLVSFGVYGTSVGARARAKRRRLRNHQYTGAFHQAGPFMGPLGRFRPFQVER